MSSLFGLLRVGYGGVQAQRALVEVAGQNIANAATPGYRRQSAVLASMPGAHAAGVQVSGFLQARDAFLSREMGASRDTLGHEQALRETLETVAPYLDDMEGNGLASALDQLFSSIGQFTQNPSNVPAREEVLSSARALTARVRQAATALENAQAATDEELEATVGQVNEDLARVATLNRQITARESSGANANALRDERDRLIQSLSGTLGVSAIDAADGSVTLVSTGGETVVQGDVAAQLSLATPPGETHPTIQVAHGQQPPSALSAPVGGRLGGLLEARDGVTGEAMAALDQFAFDFSNAFNAIHALGAGADGVAGRDFFSAPAAQQGAAMAFRVAITEPTELAAAAAPGDLPGGNDIALRLGELAHDASFGGVPGRPGELLARAGGLVARRIADARAGEEAETIVLGQIEALATSRTGVSIEEELVNVTAAQRALEASARTVKAADELLDTVLHMV